LGSGYSATSFAATGSIRPLGIVLFGKGRPVSGSRIARPVRCGSKSLPLERGRHRHEVDQTAIEPDRGPAPKEERAVSRGRPAECAAELVTAKLLRIRLAVAIVVVVVERVARVERVVPEVLERAAAEIVAARLDGHHHHRARIASSAE